MEKITLHLMGITYKPHGKSIEELPCDGPMTVKEALLAIGYPNRGIDFFIAHRNEQVIKLDAQINPGEDIFIYMPLGGG